MRLFTHALLVSALGAPITAQEIQYTILYTGRTLGYARSPDSELLAGSTTPAPNAVAIAYQALFDSAALKAAGTVLRVGMGDNFSPSLNARSFQLASGPRQMKDRYYFESGWHRASDPPTSAQRAGNTSIPFDNVAQFFMDTGYNALVPGKHDFYYGAERLRDLARLLAGRKVHMLAANLWMSSSVDSPNPRIPQRYAHHKYSTNFKDVTVIIPDTVFPYKRQFLVKNAQAVQTAAGVPVRQDLLMRRDLLNPAMKVVPAIEQVQVCWADLAKNEDPDEVAIPSMKKGNCTQLQPQPQAPAALSPDVQYALVGQTLKAGLNHLFCIQFQKGSDWACKPFPVAEPFFEHGTPVAPQATPRRYVVVPGAPPVAIFGVVDPDLLTNIGLLNTGWLNDNHHWDTGVKAAAPDSALEQLLEQCEADCECQGTRKVLLAQMSYARAAQLGTRLKRKFDVVISEADADHHTGKRVLTETATFPNLLLTPPVPYDGDAARPVDRFVPQVSAAQIVKQGGEWELRHHVCAAAPQSLDAPCTGDSCVKLVDIATAVFTARKIDPNPGATTVAPPPSLVVRDLALYAMRRHANADVAILQNRDLFNSDRLSDAPFPRDALQDRINSIFWKGDFVVTVHVTGAQLKSLLKQSAKFDAADQDPLTTEVQRNRGLVTLGLFADSKDPQTYYVNGARLDDAGLYTLATTDYLGLGDTGYPDLAAPAVPPALRIKDFHNLRALAGVICREISSIPAYQGIQCDDEPLGANYFDPTSQAPTDITAGMNTAKQYATFFKDFVNPPVPSKTREGNAQQRHFFALNLESADFSFNAVMLRNARFMSGTFTGVSTPGVTSKGTSTVGEDHKLRGIYDFRIGTLYLLSDSGFQRTKTTTSFIPSTTSNMYGFEGGGTRRLPVKGTRPSWFAFQYSVRFEGQFTQPDAVQITLQPLSTPPTTLTIPAPQTSTVYGRVGARADFADTYVELGIEEIDSRHVLSQYLFTVGQTMVYCQPSALLQFACGNDSTLNSGRNITPINQQFGTSVPPPPAISTADYLTGGVYFNFNIKVPLWSRQDPSGADLSYYFTLSNKGDWYFNSHNDTNVQTRYLDKLTPSLTIPLYGKITISPKLDIIFYENKVNRNHFRALQPAISLSYTFKWREGMRFYRALKYGAITTPPPPAPGGK